MIFLDTVLNWVAFLSFPNLLLFSCRKNISFCVLTLYPATLLYSLCLHWLFGYFSPSIFIGFIESLYQWFPHSEHWKDCCSEAILEQHCNFWYVWKISGHYSQWCSWIPTNLHISGALWKLRLDFWILGIASNDPVLTFTN